MDGYMEKKMKVICNQEMGKRKKKIKFGFWGDKI